MKEREAFAVKQFICKRKKKGLYTLVFVTGLPGTGKSYSCIRLGEILSKQLNAKKPFSADNIFDDFVSLVKFIKNAKPNEINIGVIEEVSVLFPSRRSMAGENVDINRVLDTARKKQVILLANAPLWPTIDSHMRALGNLYVETLGIDKQKKRIICKPLILQTNPHSGKTYKHTPGFRGRDINRIYFNKPSQEIIEEYEKRKDDFMDDVYEKAIHRQSKKEKKLKKEMGNKIEQPFTAEDLEIYRLKYKENKSQQEIADILGYSAQASISNKLRKIKKKMKENKEKSKK
ncbi:MAG: hypothetical protein ACOC56_04870 [Atribacterota bacterium]